ncbi:short-chain dehydrogenase [Allostella vacuolata]|nr:short-chain dehydrogenase [Stella vacuolata]
MDLELAGRTVAVTGASKGIGLAVAEGFAAEGCNLHLVARSADALERAADAIRARRQVSVATHAIDLAAAGSAEALAEACGDADILVNNAGAIPGGSLDAVDEARWRAAWDLKVFGYVNICRAFHGRMKARRSGVIVNVIGLAGERFDYGYIAGSTGNAGLMAFTRALGSYSLEHGVRVLAVNPGAVMTDRIVQLMRTRAEADHGDPERWREYFRHLPMGRPAEPREVADLVVFLGSARASYLSGVVYAVDGGAAARSGSPPA